MLHILIADGTLAAMQAERETFRDSLERFALRSCAQWGIVVLLSARCATTSLGRSAGHPLIALCMTDSWFHTANDIQVSMDRPVRRIESTPLKAQQDELQPFSAYDDAVNIVLLRELGRLEVLLEQLKTVEAERDTLLKPANDEVVSPAAMLARLKGIGPETAAVLWTEGLFRQFDNRRQVAAYAGLAPTPWQSGSIDHQQGVSKAGNPRLRTTMVELAWLWLQNQPTSALSLWFHERVQRLGGRMRKTIIVAVARKLLIALWRYTTAGVVIEGAVMKTASATI